MTDLTTIPDPEEIAELLLDQTSGCGCDECRENAIRIIAKAIHDAVMAERERCARLMEDDGEWTFAGDAAAMAIFEDVRELAADAIRAAPKSEGV